MIVLDSELRVALGLVPTITDVQTARLMLAAQAGHAAVRKYLKYDPEQKVGPAEFYPRADSYGLSGGDYWEKAGSKAVQIAASGVFAYLQLQRLPVRVVSEVRVDYAALHGQQSGDFGGGTLWTAGTEYSVEWDYENYCSSGCLIAVGGWPATLGTVKVTYRAGFSPLEFNGPAESSGTDADGKITVAGVDASPIKVACMLECIRAYHTTAAFAQSALTGLLIPGPKQSENLGSYSYSLASGASAAMLTSMGLDISPQAAGYLEEFVNYGVMVG